MAGKKSSSKRLYWQELVDRQGCSGLSIRQFCLKEGVSEPSFYAWRRQLTTARTRAQRRQAESRPAKEHQFVPLKLVELSTAIEIVHPLGCQVRITGTVDTSALAQVLAVLDSRGDA